MGEIRFVGTGETRGYPYPVCKKIRVDCDHEKQDWVLFPAQYLYSQTAMARTPLKP